MESSWYQNMYDILDALGGRVEISGPLVFSTSVVRCKRTWKRWQTVEMIGGRSFPYCDLWTLVQTALTLVFTCTGDPLYTFDLNCTLYFWNTAIRIEIPKYTTSNRIVLHIGCFAIILQRFLLLCEIICKHIDHLQPCNSFFGNTLFVMCLHLHGLGLVGWW